MRQIDNATIDALKQIAADVRGLSSDDKESIVKIGVALEALISEIPDELPESRTLLITCLEGLQAVYQESVSNLDDLISAIGNGIDIISQAGNPAYTASICEAGTALWQSLDREISESPFTESANAISSVDSAPSCLDDIAALLVQLDSSDISELTAINESLKDFASKDCCPNSVKRLLDDANQLLDKVVTGKSEDPSSAVTEVGQLIEAAMDAIDEPELEIVSKEHEEEESVQVPVVEEPVKLVLTESAPVLKQSQPDQLPADADHDLLKEFITECGEYIEGAEAALLSLESDQDNLEAVNTVFRAFHTIKGTSAFLGLNRTSELAHHAESLLSRVRDQEIRCTGGYADLALRSIDTLKELILNLQDALNGDPMTIPAGYDDLMRLLSDPEAAGINGDAIAAPTIEKPSVDDQPTVESAEEFSVLQASVPAAAARAPKRNTAAENAAESSVRVRTDRLDRLIDTVGELVIAQSMVSQDEQLVLSGHHDLAKKVIHMGKIVRELQYLSMSMRMVPLKATFQKMARLVRDVARRSGKMVEFITEGEDTEIDRNMVDIINDPLVHMVRNAVDHGIESPEVRQENGKSPTGLVRLYAYHSGGNVVVEMKDDGKGLDRDKIVEKAIAKGLIESDKGMSDGEVFNLIFEPGFSTADKVTDISGRGVGLDVVKKSVESIRGRIEISSQLGKGSVFSIRLPLTLAVTDGMLVQVGAERFIIPTINIHMSFRPDADMLSTVTGRGELVMLRGELMPVFRLHRLLGIEGAIEDPTEGLLVILDDGDRRCAVLVDELLGQHHVVAKALSDGIGKIQGISGGAILGDGRVGLILDVGEVAALARQISDGHGCKDPHTRSVA